MVRFEIIRNKLAWLTFTMFVAVLIVSGIGTYILYKTSISETADRLIETVQSNARIIERIAEYDVYHSKDHTPGHDTALGLIREAHENFQFGHTGEFAMAKLEGEKIVFLLRNRQIGMDIPEPVDANQSNRAEPMYRALAGKSGWMIGKDYQGVEVLAAYEPVKFLNYGIVAKIEMSEIILPFIRAGLIIFGLAILVSLLSMIVFYRLSMQISNRFRDSSKQFNRLASNATDVIYRMSLPDGKYEYVNDSAIDVFGEAPEVWYKTPKIITNMVHPDWRNYFECEWQKLLAGNMSPTYEYQIVTESGETKWIHQRNVLITDQDGIPTAIEAIVTDVTTTKEAENKIRLSEQGFKAIFDQAAVGVARVGIDGAWLEVNEKLCEIVGYQKEEFLSRTFQDITHPEDLDSDLGYLNRLLNDEIKTYSMEKRYYKKSGEIVWVNLTVSLVRNINKEPDYFISIVEDISDRKKTHDLLNTTEKMTHIGGWEWDIQANVFTMSDEWLQIHGVTNRNLPMSDLMTIAHPDDAAAIEERFKLAIEGDEDYEITHRIVRQGDGAVRSIYAKASVERDYEGKPIKMVGTAQDITAQIESRKALAESEQRFSELFMGSKSIELVIDPDSGNVIEANHAAEKFYGYKRESLLALNIADLNILTNEQVYKEMQLAKTESRDHFFFKHRLASGEIKDVEVHSGPIHWGAKKALYSIIHDITDRRLAEEMVIESANNLKAASELTSAIVSELNVGISIYSESGQCEMANDAIIAMTGAPSIDVLLKQNFNTIKSWEKSGLYEKARKALDDGSAQHIQIEMETTFKKQVILDCYFIAIHISGEKKLLLTAYDTSQLRDYEDGLRMLSSSVKQTNEAICITAPNGDIEYINPAFSQLTGYSEEEVIGQNPSILNSGSQSPKFYEEMWSVINDGEAWQGRVIDKKKDGTFYPAMLTISPINNIKGELVNYVGVQQDLSKYEDLEGQFHQAQKMEAMGTLVGGIAHDFNNMLAGMTGNIYLAEKRSNDNPFVLQKLKNIETLSFRASDMIKQLLTFARKGDVIIVPLPLTPFIKESLKLFRTSVPENIALNHDICSDILTINGDATQLHQVLMNLINNARDSLEGRDAPHITVKLKEFYTDEGFLEKRPYFKKNTYAHLSVEDNGCGIAEGDIDHLFEPFYTTKEQGKGTGLGLAMVYGAIKTHHGHVEVESIEGEKTTFHVYLPLLETEDITDATIQSEEIQSGHGETILLVDDEVNILHTGRDVLEDLGYTVLTGENGQQAVDVFEKHSDEIDLIILDVVMPIMGGVDAALAIRAIDKTAKVIFVSGYDRTGATKESDSLKSEVMIAKPFSIQVMSRMIREKLNS